MKLSSILCMSLVILMAMAQTTDVAVARRPIVTAQASAPLFPVNTSRYDPYKTFKFRVKWDGRYVAGVSKVGGLKRTTEVVEHRGGGDPSTNRKSPGQSDYEAITLDRGVTHDPDFEQWASKVSSKDFRKDVIIERYDESGKLVETYKVFRCWVSEYQALPDHDANANAFTIQHIRLENEGYD